ncbi:dihydroxy-acid dehydratase [Aliikangiella sp. G2MR2-5]|uniref:dihydroxy-acid dehydratase domain-containing protein n=1 Tax=Aliikangiella sp. G2MR2-5 TaxID=2788943 RepID=UPI0018AA2EE5|nr:dihydroxy-acid dehydratase [Aliikangiella sp. G2MR2-5]
MVHSIVAKVTRTIKERSCRSRDSYLKKISLQRTETPYRQRLACGNLAHGFAACSAQEKLSLSENKDPNLAIVSAYNEMLSAHQPYFEYPEIIRKIARQYGSTVQFAGGVPAMCDGVTQGLPGMELSLFSRDHIAMSTAIALSHQMFDGVVLLGICDKIVPGLLIGALSFGHLPTIFIPAGPMTSGISNKEKASIRQLYAQGKVDKKTLLKTESESYHSPGTCTFYGTANSNQMLMEIMGLQLAGSSFENPDSKLRKPLTEEAVIRLTSLAKENGRNICLADIVDEKAIVNGITGLLASGGSTNHTLHLIAIARAAGIQITWQDMAELSKVIPLLCRVYPNGEADINQFHQSGGMAFLIRELLAGNLLHNDVNTVMGFGLENYCRVPELVKQKVIITDNHDKQIKIEASDKKNVIREKVVWQAQTGKSKDKDTLREVNSPFSNNGGLKLLSGNLGRAIIKTSAVEKSKQTITAPAKIFYSQEAVIEAFKQGQLYQDFIAVVIFQGPKSNGMPELHKLTPILGSLQDQGYKVALVTDGRMSGASGKVPAAIHLSPEALEEGMIGKLRDGDMVTLDCQENQLSVDLDEAQIKQRSALVKRDCSDQYSVGRELFSIFRDRVSSAEEGATIFDFEIRYSTNNQTEFYPREVTYDQPL